MEYNNMPDIASAKLEDFPTKALAEYSDSRFRGIFKISAPLPEWNIVPRSSAQNLIETLISQDQQKSEDKELKAAYQEKVVDLNKKWGDIEEMEKALKNAFLETEEKIKELRNCELASGKTAIEKNDDLVKETEHFDQLEHNFREETMKINNAIRNMEEDIKSNSSYMDFATAVAQEHPALYPAGAKSVLQHYERLKSAHKEITSDQENSLMKMKQLRKEAQQFTSETLLEFDLLEAEIHETSSSVLSQQTENEEQAKTVLARKEMERALSGETRRMEDSMKCIYEQMWKRYHGPSSTPHTKSLNEQAAYIQLTMAALENLVRHLKGANPKSNESLDPEPSVYSKSK